MRAVHVLVLFALSGCGRRSQSSEKSTKLPNVEVVSAEEREVTRSLRGAGIVRAKEASVLGFKVGGVVSRVAV